MSSSFFRLVAVRGIALACLAGLLALGLYVTKRGEQMRALKRARALPPVLDPAWCPRVERSTQTWIRSDELDEVSGMVASRKQDGLYWVHNDSGDDARIFAVDLEGNLRAEVELADVDARDFEDIALLSQPAGQADVIYVADTGNNLKTRRTVQIYKLREPTIPHGNAAMHITRDVETIEINYEDGTHDVEAIIVESTGDIYMITKAHLLAREDVVGVYRVTAADARDGQAIAHRVASMPLGPVTAADVSPDGRAVAVRNYWSALYWPIPPGQTLTSVFQQPPCHLQLKESGHQGEALAFTPDGTGFLTTAEAKHPTVFRYSYQPPES